tara:strand:+ start:248 stop:394 length:147 start_codon:yes stop_codon:yes gene_type:complete
MKIKKTEGEANRVAVIADKKGTTNIAATESNKIGCFGKTFKYRIRMEK